MFTSGYLEDPATGSANGNLAAYLLEHNFFGESEINYRVEQGYSIGDHLYRKSKPIKLRTTFSCKLAAVFLLQQKENEFNFQLRCRSNFFDHEYITLIIRRLF